MAGISLGELDEADIDYVVAHEAQRDTGRLIAELVQELRLLDSVDENFEFQRELAGAIFEAEEQLLAANRNAKRMLAGRPTASPPGRAWELERRSTSGSVDNCGASVTHSHGASTSSTDGSSLRCRRTPRPD